FFSAPLSPVICTLSLHDALPIFTGLEDRYFLTIRATLKTMASSNSRRSRPVIFLIFSRRYTSVLRCTNSFLEVSDTFRLFSKKRDRKSTRLNSSHVSISYAVFCL